MSIWSPESDDRKYFSRESILESDFQLKKCHAEAEAGAADAQAVLGDCYQYGDRKSVV